MHKNANIIIKNTDAMAIRILLVKLFSLQKAEVNDSIPFFFTIHIIGLDNRPKIGVGDT